MGGNTPIGNGVVTLYSTTATGTVSIVNGVYSGTATVLGTTTTADGTGYFSFGTVNSCAANSLVYITISGGNTGGGANAQELLGSIYGVCGSLASFATVDEASTVAMAYAMSSFTTIDGSGNVNIVAPANNSSTASSNDASSSTATATTASGLSHAYANFLNLVNVPNGAAYSVPPSNSGGVAPQAVINTLASALQVCVNSTGGSGTTNCGKLFAVTPPLSSTTPTNTFQAALNVARNPYSSSSNVNGLFNLLTGIGASAVYSPTLTSAPKDWTLAISYPVPANPYSGIGFPFALALDADDNVYVTSPETDVYVANSSYTTASNSASACLFGFSSTGKLLPTVVPYTAGGTASVPGTPGNGTAGTSTWYCATGASSSNPTLLTQLAPDALGNIWIANTTPSGLNTSTTSSENVLLKVSTSAPSSATAYISPSGYAPKAVVVDKNNDVFFAHNYSLNSVVGQYCLTAGGATGPANSGAGSCSILGTSVSANLASASSWLALDASQNLFSAGYAGTAFATGTSPAYGGGLDESQQTGSGSSPSYGGGWIKKSVDGGTPANNVQEAPAPFGMAIDSAGFPWVNFDAPANGGTNTFAVAVAKAAFSSGAITTTPTSANVTTLGLAAPKWMEFDGNNVLWIMDSGGVIAYSTTASPSVAALSPSGGFVPCLAGSAVTCTYPDFSSAKSVAVDSTGSVWFTTPDSTTSVANSNRLIQLIGTASSAWPLLATGKPGAMPQ
jgi:hypothetical protein